jgi:hypothetical protein
MIRIKKLFSAKYKKPGTQIDLDMRFAKHILMQEAGTLEMYGQQRAYTICMIIDKSKDEQIKEGLIEAPKTEGPLV